MIFNRKHRAIALLITDLILGILVLWVISTGEIGTNQTNQKHFVALLLFTGWISWLTLYYLEIPPIADLTRRGLRLIRGIIQPLYQLFENIHHYVWCGLLFSSWCGYIGLNIVLERRLEPRTFITEGYITEFSLGQVFSIANRPITVPLFYKLLGNDIYRIEVMQYMVSIICWTILALAIMHILHTRLLKLLGWVVILLFSVNRELFFWHSMLLSESLSHSLLATGLGLGILTIEHVHTHAEKISSRPQLVLAVGITFWLFLWSQTRDANSYALLALAGLLLIFVIYQKLQRQRQLILPSILVMSCIVLFAGQTLHANRGHRWHIPYLNILGDRILPDEDNTTYFIAHDMPYNERVSQYAGQRAWAFQPEHDLRYEINDWLTTKGRFVYLQYLMTQPIETLSAPIMHWQQLLAYHYSLTFLADMERHSDVPPWLNAYSCLVYWDDIATCHVIRNPSPENHFSFFFPLIMTVNAAIIVFLASTYGWDRRQIYPLAMLFFMYVLGFVTWHGDADSIERHGVQVNILWRLSLWFAVIFACDWILLRNFLPNQPSS